MSNHYHLLLKTPNSDIDKFMYWFNKTFSELLKEKTGRINRMFGSNYKWSLIKDQSYLKNVVSYIYQNPVRAKIVQNPEDYRFSTLFFIKHHLELGFTFTKEIDFQDELFFFNNSFKETELKQIKIGLTKSVFKIPGKRSKLRS